MKWGKKDLCEEECLIKNEPLNSGTGQPEVNLHEMILYNITLSLAPNSRQCPTHQHTGKKQMQSRLLGSLMTLSVHLSFGRHRREWKPVMSGPVGENGTYPVLGQE